MVNAQQKNAWAHFRLPSYAEMSGSTMLMDELHHQLDPGSVPKKNTLD